jgi:hypothetical protein
MKMQDFQRIPEQQTNGGLGRWPRITPLAHDLTVHLPVSIDVARAKLTARLSGIFTVDGGMHYLGRTGVRYRDLQQYTGVVDGDSFNLAGPFFVGTIPTSFATIPTIIQTIPTIIEGELHSDGQASRVHLSVRTALGNMWRSLFGLFLVLVFAVLVHFWLIVPGLLFGALYFYLVAAFMVRRQLRLLIDQRFLA